MIPQASLEHPLSDMMVQRYSQYANDAEACQEWRMHIFGHSLSSRFQKLGMRRSGTDNPFQDGRNRQPLANRLIPPEADSGNCRQEMRAFPRVYLLRQSYLLRLWLDPLQILY